SIRAALGTRAARDLAQADLERAVSGQQVVWLAGLAFALGFLLLSWWLFSPGQMLSLLQRAFTPFTEVSIAKKTRITMLQPPEGNTSVRENQKIDFRVLIEGRVPRPKAPDAPMLCYRHRLSDEYRMIEMDQGADGEWTATVLADQVSPGFWYKVTAGDTQ